MCIYMCTYACILTQMCPYIHTHTHIYTCIHVYAYTNIYFVLHTGCEGTPGTDFVGAILAVVTAQGESAADRDASCCSQCLAASMLAQANT